MNEAMGVTRVGDAAAEKSADRVAFVITGEPHVIALGYESWLAGLTSEVSHSFFGGPDRIRTCDTWFRKPLLYPLSYGALPIKGLTRVVRQGRLDQPQTP